MKELTGIPDARDIEVKLLPEARKHAVLGSFEGKYKLRNYRGPIAYVNVQVNEHFFYFRIGMLVVDVETQKPVHLTADKSWAIDLIHYYSAPEEAFENMLIESIRWVHNHELDECLLRDGEHVTDPHPETKKRQLRQADTLPLAELERARASLLQSAAQSSG